MIPVGVVYCCRHGNGPWGILYLWIWHCVCNCVGVYVGKLWNLVCVRCSLHLIENLSLFLSPSLPSFCFLPATLTLICYHLETSQHPSPSLPPSLPPTCLDTVLFIIHLINVCWPTIIYFNNYHHPVAMLIWTFSLQLHHHAILVPLTRSLLVLLVYCLL